MHVSHLLYVFIYWWTLSFLGPQLLYKMVLIILIYRLIMRTENYAKCLTENVHSVKGSYYWTAQWTRLWEHLLWAFWRTNPRPWLQRDPWLPWVGWIWMASLTVYINSTMSLLYISGSQIGFCLNIEFCKKFEDGSSNPFMILMWETGQKQEEASYLGDTYLLPSLQLYSLVCFISWEPISRIFVTSFSCG